MFAGIAVNPALAGVILVIAVAATAGGCAPSVEGSAATTMQSEPLVPTEPSTTPGELETLPTLARVVVPEHLSISNCCHVLLYYGLGSTDIAGLDSGQRVLAALTDEQEATRRFGASPFIVTRHGLRYLLSADPV